MSKYMQISVDQELLDICKDIHKRSLSSSEWSEVESSDMFQSKNYCGGFDADENEFCFSYYQSSNQEIWFQFGLETIQEILAGKTTKLEARKAQ